MSLEKPSRFALPTQVMAAILVLVGCDDPSEPATETAPVAAPEAPAPEAEDLVERVPPEPSEPEPLPLDPPSYAERRTDLPDVLDCPGREICVTEYDFVVWVLKRGWRHHYRLDYGSPTTAIRAGGVPRAQWRARLAAGVAHVLSEEGASAALGHCSLAQMMPELYAANDGVLVDVPPRQGPSTRPPPVPPEVANAHLRSEYAFINIERAPSMAWFTSDELENMTGSSFESPRVRHVGAWKRMGGVHRSLDLLIAFSPESEDVYVLERTREMPEEEYLGQSDERRRSDEQGLVDFIRSLGVRQLTFEAGAACEIPAAFGGGEWRPIRVD